MCDSSCRCCCGFLFTLGIAALIMWLSSKTSKPSCSIKYFYVPALDKALNATTDTAIDMELALKNTNKDKGVFYDPINITFYEKSNVIGSLIIPGFYQGHGKGTKRKNNVETHNVKWGALRTEVANRTAFFRVDLATDVRYKIVSYKTKREKLRVGADVLVDDEGLKDSKKDIKLKSGSKKITWWKEEGVLITIAVMSLLY